MGSIKLRVKGVAHILHHKSSSWASPFPLNSVGYYEVCVSIICCNDELSLTMSWVGCLLKDSEIFILFAENSQILVKISVISIFLTLMYLVASPWG